MILYHYSTLYKGTGGGSLVPDYARHYRMAEPFILALGKGRAVFEGMLYAGMYVSRELHDAKIRTYESWQKDAAEAIFEFIRETEYPDAVSRLKSVFYCSTKEEAVKYAMEDCIGCGDYKKEEVVLLEVELDDGARLACYDQAFYNEAYKAVERYDADAAFPLARRYFALERSREPLIEIASDAENRILRRLEY